MRKLFAFLFLLMALAATPGFAVEPGEMLSDPVLEARARDISKGLRCLVCQNESIDDSGADLAHDIRVLVRERLTAGDSNAAVVAYMVHRYGDFVLLQPPVVPRTWLLWFGPIGILILGAVGALLLARCRSKPEPAPLTDAERQRIDQLLKGETP